MKLLKFPVNDVLVYPAPKAPAQLAERKRADMKLTREIAGREEVTALFLQSLEWKLRSFPREANASKRVLGREFAITHLRPADVARLLREDVIDLEQVAGAAPKMIRWLLDLVAEIERLR